MVTVNGGTLNLAGNNTVGAVVLTSGTISGTGTLTSAPSYRHCNNGTVEQRLSEETAR